MNASHMHSSPVICIFIRVVWRGLGDSVCPLAPRTPQRVGSCPRDNLARLFPKSPEKGEQTCLPHILEALFTWIKDGSSGRPGGEIISLDIKAGKGV